MKATAENQDLQPYKKKFITYVYSPIVSPGALAASPASDITNGIVEITLLPRLDLTLKATPKVIINNDTNRSRCCQMNDIIFSLTVVSDCDSVFIIIQSFLTAN